MRELQISELESIEGKGWGNCAAMVLLGVATVAGTIAAASNPLTWGAIGLIGIGVGETLEQAGKCEATAG